MPQKRKATAAKTAPAKKVPAKKAKVEDEEEAGPSDIMKTMGALKKSDSGKKTHKVDTYCSLSDFFACVSTNLIPLSI